MVQARWIALGAALLAAACNSLPDVEPGVCGNKVVEAGEDCDGFAEDGASCGAAGTGNGCFFVCESSEAGSACPAGYGCGADGRCRRPSGELALASQFAFPVPGFQIADIDGDGVPDLVGSSQNRLHVVFGNGGGGVANQVDFPSAADRGLVSLGDLNEDGRTDIVAATAAGITAFLGRPGQSIEPVTFPSFQLPELDQIKIFAVTGRFGGLIDQERLFGILEVGGAGGVIELIETGAGAPVSAPAETLFGPGFAVGAVFTPFAVANVDADENDEVALSHLGAATAWVLDLDAGLGRGISVKAALDLPTPFVAAGRPFLADFDGDGDRDLVLRMRNSTTGAVALGRSLNTGGAFGAVTLASSEIADDIDLLAVDRLNGDNAADFAFSTGLLLGDGGPINILDFGDIAINGNWNAATMADLNGDGRVDLVAVPDGAPGIEVYLQSPSSQFNRFIVGSSAFFQGNGELLAGDFDGDFITDVALTARSPGAGDELEVLFGSPGGGFEPPTRMARFESIAQIVTIGVLEEESPDGIADLLVLGTQAARDVVATLQGDSSRSMVSPLFLIQPEVELEPGSPEDVFYVPLQAVIGRVGDTVGVMAATFSLGDGIEAPPEDCSLPFFGCTFAWALPGLGDGQLDAEAAAIAPLGIDLAQLPCHLWKTANLDGGSDELIGVTATAACPGVPPQAGYFALDAGEMISLEIAEGTTGLGDFIVADVDGDGDLDIVTIYGRFVAGEPAGIAIYDNQEGGFTAAELVASGEVVPLTIGAGALDASAGVDLVFTGLSTSRFEEPPGIYVAGFSPESGTWQAPAQRPELGVGVAVGVADMNRDGVDDLVVGDGVGATVYLGVPAPPGPVATGDGAGEQEQEEGS
jgi:hypothetical protein